MITTKIERQHECEQPPMTAILRKAWTMTMTIDDDDVEHEHENENENECECENEKLTTDN